MLLEQVVSGHWRLDGLLETIDEMAVLCDAELRVVQGNRAFAARTGVSRDDLAGRELRDLVGDPLARWAHHAATASEAPTTPAETRAGPLGAAVRVHAGAIRGEGADATGLVLVARDDPPAAV
jgi:PAS domain S-box-containing protein